MVCATQIRITVSATHWSGNPKLMVFIVHFLCIDGVWMLRSGITNRIPLQLPSPWPDGLGWPLLPGGARPPSGDHGSLQSTVECDHPTENVSYSIVKVSEVSGHKVINMSNMLREYNTVHGYKACIPKQCATILYSVCVVQFLSHGSWHLPNIYSTTVVYNPPTEIFFHNTCIMKKDM